MGLVTRHALSLPNNIGGAAFCIKAVCNLPGSYSGIVLNLEEEDACKGVGGWNGAACKFIKEFFGSTGEAHSASLHSWDLLRERCVSGLPFMIRPEVWIVVEHFPRFWLSLLRVFTWLCGSLILFLFLCESGELELLFLLFLEIELFEEFGDFLCFSLELECIFHLFLSNSLDLL
jgi:hypothetical protein